MRHARFLLVSALALSLAGCNLLGGEAASEPVKTEQAKTKPKPTPTALATPLTEAEVAVIRDGITKAMDEVPPELRNDFQKAFTCDAAKDSSAMTAERIRAITARLKADRSIANCKI